MMGRMVEIGTREGDGAFAAYCAQPSSPPRAAVVVMQEIFGLNPGIRAKVDRWAEQGYLSVAPDLFWRQAPGVELDPEAPADREQAFTRLVDGHPHGATPSPGYPPMSYWCARQDSNLQPLDP